ncbi:GNAT family N-acetyltransferase [Planctomonas deserti]|uniref:GNAT family N-acetyltransferase n=1 Tax=Planctomonas deserti TaxID=2144185 RepID=UPI00197B7A4F|nr:GNAT family N-acetyltransferase [Planctomonas deserti]
MSSATTTTTPRAGDLALRRALPADARAIADLIRSAKATAMPWLAVPHTAEEDRNWVATVLLPEQDVWLATRGDVLAGVAALTPGHLEQLYVATEHQGAGVGRLLLDHAKRLHPGGLQLWVFQRNARARRFYETAGFVLAEVTDGAATEEREPDARYEWTPGGSMHG